MSHDDNKSALSRIASLPEADLDHAFGGGQGGQKCSSPERTAEELATLRRRKPLGHVRRG